MVDLPREMTPHPEIDCCDEAFQIIVIRVPYRRRNRIEIVFGRLKDWRRIATRNDRCAGTFPSAVARAATVLFWP